MLSKFDAFMDIVQKTAAAENCMFFLKNGEGREFETDAIEGEDLFGWLIPDGEKDEFLQGFRREKIGGEWDEFLVFAIWCRDGEKSRVNFKRFV